MEEKSIFVLRLVGREETSFNENVIGIGWSEARGLDSIEDWTAFKEAIRAAYPSYSNHGLGNIGSSIWSFVHGMKAGSLAIVPLADGFRVAEVLEDAPYYDEDARVHDPDYAWRRRAKWLTEESIPRDYASNLLQRKMKTQYTCLDITESQLHDDLVRAMRRNAPISFKSELYADASSVVFEHLLKSVTPTDLEHLIAKIYRANGHHAVRQHTRQEEEGDVDVLVEIDTGLGQQSKPISIGIQVKQHEGVTDKYAVEQIAARLGEGQSLDRGIVVTTAGDFDEDAKRLAVEHDIALVGREEWRLGYWTTSDHLTTDAPTNRPATMEGKFILKVAASTSSPDEPESLGHVDLDGFLHEFRSFDWSSEVIKHYWAKKTAPAIGVTNQVSGATFWTWAWDWLSLLNSAGAPVHEPALSFVVGFSGGPEPPDIYCRKEDRGLSDCEFTAESADVVERLASLFFTDQYDTLYQELYKLPMFDS